MSEQTRFVALYEGDTITSAHIVGATTDPRLVRMTERILRLDGCMSRRYRIRERLRRFFVSLKREETDE